MCLVIIRPELTASPLTAAELDSANWLLQRESRISAALVRGLVPEYARLRAQWAKRYRGNDFEAVMPAVIAPENFRSLIGLAAVYVHPPIRDGAVYAGFLFGCTWDPEHGAGVLMKDTAPLVSTLMGRGRFRGIVRWRDTRRPSPRARHDLDGTIVVGMPGPALAGAAGEA